jgi:hypothetical protein
MERLFFLAQLRAGMRIKNGLAGEAGAALTHAAMADRPKGIPMPTIDMIAAALLCLAGGAARACKRVLIQPPVKAAKAPASTPARARG